MIVVCAWLPHFPLRVVAHTHADAAAGLPMALASDAEAHPVVLDCDEAARAFGVAPGMLISRALGCCSSLVVLPCDVQRVEAAADRFAARLEDLGAAVQFDAPGRAYFDAAPLLLLHGGLDVVLARVLEAYRAPDLRLGVAPGMFASWALARHAAAGAWLRATDDGLRRMLAPMPIDILPADDEFLRLVRALGIDTLGDFASIDAGHVTDRFGERGALLHALARGEERQRLEPRVPAEPVSVALDFPDAVGNDLTLARALEVLAERIVAHPRCVQHAPRSVVLSCTLADGAGGTRSRRVLRVPTVDPRAIALVARPMLDDLSAPVERMELRFDGFEPRAYDQQQLLGSRGSALAGEVGAGARTGMQDERVQRGMRQVQEMLGADALLQVLEIEPWSRVPERHAVLVPRRAMAATGRDVGDPASTGRGVWH